MSVWSFVPSTAEACGPAANTGTAAPVCCWLGGAAGGRVAARGAVRHAHRLPVDRREVVRVARRVVLALGVLGDDLARVRVVGRHDDERVRVAGLVVQGDADRVVERDRLADLARTRWPRGPACRSRRPRPAGRSPCRTRRAARAPSTSSPTRLGSFAGRWPVSHVCAGVPAPSVACGPFHSVVMLLALKRPSSGLEPSAAASAGGVLDDVVAQPLRVVDDGRRPPSVFCSKRPRPPPSVTSALWSTICSAIEPRPPAAFVSVLQSSAVSSGPWQPRSDMCDARTAGVASVISAVETLPVFLPAFWAGSRTVGEVLAGHVDRRARALGDPLVDGLLAGRPHRAGGRGVGVVVGEVGRGRRPA